MNKHAATLTITAAVVLAITTTAAHADHVDNNTWIETAEGNFIIASDKAQDSIDKNYAAEYNILSRDNCKIPQVNFGDNSRPKTTRINEYLMIDQRRGECGDKQAEENRLNLIYDSGGYTPTTEEYLEYHECVCGYWYENTVKDEYTYTIIDLPRDSELPAGYKEVVEAGVEAGLDRWGDINDINFRETDSRLKANIIIQQQIGDGRTYGNAEIGCLFDNQQCTIQLFSDLNVRNEQTLQNKESIEFVIAHEFGHLIGLPHHIDPEHIMNTVHANDVRTYYEARNISVPRMAEPTHEQSLLGYTDPVQTTENGKWNADNITEHKAYIEFIKLLKAILLNTPENDRLDIWLSIKNGIQDDVWNILFP